MPRAAAPHDPNALPLPTRRGLARERAAEYVGIGTTLFDFMVADGRMPKPKRIGGRCIWDVRKLDESFDLLPGDVESVDNPWDA